MTVSVFIGTSVDGFIARPNGDLDFLPPGGGVKVSNSDHLFLLLAAYYYLVMR